MSAVPVPTRLSFDNFRARIPEGKSGEWEVKRFTVTKDAAALAVFTQRCHILPGAYTRLTFGRWDTVMSDTHDEYRTHWDLLRRAHGRVLLNGLGLGCALGAILDKTEVEHVDVVEKSSDVLALVGPTFISDSRVSLIHADAFEQAKRWPKGAWWDVVWHDIWTNISVDDLAEHARLLRSYARRCGWQGAWRHQELVGLKRAGRWR